MLFCIGRCSHTIGVSERIYTPAASPATMAKLLACVFLIAALAGNALAATPAAGTQLVEVRVASDDDVKEVTPRLNAIKEAIATNLCAVPVADVHISSVEADVDNSGDVDGSRVVATCTPAAGQLKAVRDACIAGARQTRSAAWADNLNIQNVNCGETVATAATAKGAATTTTASTAMPAAATAEALPASSSAITATATGTPAVAAAPADAVPAAAAAPNSGAGAAAASTVLMAMAGAAALVLV